MLSVYNKKTVIGHNLHFICCYSYLGVVVMKVIGIDFKSIKAEDTDIETLEELAETEEDAQFTTEEPIIQAQVRGDDESSSQVQTICANDSMVTAQKLQNEMKINDNLKYPP